VHTPAELTDAALDFLRERHLATLTTLRADGTPHVVPVGFTWEPGTALARVIASGTSQKARQAARGGPVAICQVDGRRWLTLEGVATVSSEPAVVADAEARYAARYRVPRINPRRVAIEVRVERVLGSADFFSP
jgi:PPOX class probable F420-dependent enzyme